jgi:hypothetical protein
MESRRKNNSDNQTSTRVGLPWRGGGAYSIKQWKPRNPQHPDLHSSTWTPQLDHPNLETQFEHRTNLHKLHHHQRKFNPNPVTTPAPPPTSIHPQHQFITNFTDNFTSTLHSSTPTPLPHLVHFFPPTGGGCYIIPTYVYLGPLTREPGRAVALGRVLVVTWPNFNDLCHF